MRPSRLTGEAASSPPRQTSVAHRPRRVLYYVAFGRGRCVMEANKRQELCIVRAATARVCSGPRTPPREHRSTAELELLNLSSSFKRNESQGINLNLASCQPGVAQPQAREVSACSATTGPTASPGLPAGRASAAHAYTCLNCSCKRRDPRRF